LSKLSPAKPISVAVLHAPSPVMVTFATALTFK